MVPPLFKCSPISSCSEITVISVCSLCPACQRLRSLKFPEHLGGLRRVQGVGIQPTADRHPGWRLVLREALQTVSTHKKFRPKDVSMSLTLYNARLYLQKIRTFQIIFSDHSLHFNNLNGYVEHNKMKYSKMKCLK